MHLRKVLLAAIAVTIMTFSVGLRGQGGFVDGVKVTLPEPVTVDDKVLEPGVYEIRRASQFQDQILRIYNQDKMVYETNVLTIPALGKETPEDSKVILHHIGDNYYFDKIWIQGKDYGYEFRLPERARVLQRELAVTVPATASSQDQVAQVQSEVQREGPGLSDQLDALAAQQERDHQAAITETQPEPANNQVAALQPEPPPIAPSQAEAVETPQQSQQSQQAIQSDTPEQLPETATNWLAFVIGGFLLLTLSLFFRPRMQE